MKIESGETVLVLAPHCDDELLACGGIMQRALSKNCMVVVVFMTNGDGFGWSAKRNYNRLFIDREKYKRFGRLRQREAQAAGLILGLNRDNIAFLGFPDGGLEYLWLYNWKEDEPYSSHYTGVHSNPYSLSYREKQLYAGVNVVNNLREIILTYRPNKIFSPSVYDDHPDHRATCIFSQYVLAGWQQSGDLKISPEFYQYLVHWRQWPMSIKNNRRLKPPLGLVQIINNWIDFNLTADERFRKIEGLKAYRTQMKVMRRYLLSFTTRNELYIGNGTAFLQSDRENKIPVSAVPGKSIYYEPSGRGSHLYQRHYGGADIKKLTVLEKGIGQGLEINLELRKGYNGKYKFIITLFLLAFTAEDARRKIQLLIPGNRRRKVEVINNEDSIKYEIERLEKGVRLILLSSLTDFQYLCFNAVSLYRNRKIDRTPWRIISIENRINNK